MIKPYHKKIAIVGCAGSGKTTLALHLKDKLNLPVYHLDQFHWKAGWKRVDDGIFREMHDALCEQDEWIIEGSYSRLFFDRALHADTIIFLDIPRYKCIWYVLKRTIVYYGKVIPGNSEGCKQRLFSFEYFEFLKWVWNFKKRNRKMILSIIELLKNEKQVIILRSFKDVRLF